MQNKSQIPIDRIENKIYFIREYKVMLDSDLADIFGTTTSKLNEQVKRNHYRFPVDFMFQLTKDEWVNLKLQLAKADSLRSQNAILKTGRGKQRKYLPYVFTEHGAVMLASVVNSKVAVTASIKIVRVFVKLREILSTHKELSAKLQMLESKTDKHDNEIKILFQAIRQLMQPPVQPRKRIGFKKENES